MDIVVLIDPDIPHYENCCGLTDELQGGTKCSGVSSYAIDFDLVRRRYYKSVIVRLMRHPERKVRRAATLK